MAINAYKKIGRAKSGSGATKNVEKPKENDGFLEGRLPINAYKEIALIALKIMHINSFLFLEIDNNKKRLKELSELNKMGIISNGEFEKLKKDLV